MPYTNLASSALSVWRALESYGADPAVLFKRAGLDPQKLYDSNARYRDSRLYKLWQLAVEATGDPYIGLKVASFWHPSAAHALGYSWLASATLEDALERTVRYYRLMTDKEELILEESDEEFRLIIENPAVDYPTAPEDLDASFAALVYLCRMCYGEPFNPLRITMRRQELPDPAPFEEFFRVPIQYSGNEDSMCFDKVDARTPLPTANAEVARANERLTWIGRESHGVHQNLALNLAHRGQWEQARRHYERSLEIHPSIEAWYTLAHLHVNLGDVPATTRGSQRIPAGSRRTSSRLCCGDRRPWCFR